MTYVKHSQKNVKKKKLYIRQFFTLSSFIFMQSLFQILYNIGKCYNGVFFPRNRRKEDHKSTGSVPQYCHHRRLFLTVRRPFGRCGNLATGSRCARRLPNATLLTTSMLISVLRPDIDNI